MAATEGDRERSRDNCSWGEKRVRVFLDEQAGRGLDDRAGLDDLMRGLLVLNETEFAAVLVKLGMADVRTTGKFTNRMRLRRWLEAAVKFQPPAPTPTEEVSDGLSSVPEQKGDLADDVGDACPPAV